ncbi:MAG: D-2-hydroxyacid dehydrogenase [Desulfofustis sp.]|nr:D-2-hydroxyacid dehydrogenase [Desulfofustis sp.]
MKVLILEEYSEYYKNKIQEDFPQLEIGAAIDENSATDFIEQAQILIAIKASDELISKAVNLRWIQSLISGTDFFTKLPSLNRDVLISSSRGIHGPQMAETTILLMLALNRNLPANFKNQESKHWERWPTQLLYQKSIGILGVGTIGTELARICKSFGMIVHGLTTTGREIEWVDYPYDSSGLNELISRVDYLVNILPATPETQKVLGLDQFSSMKRTAYYISVGRGDTVDEEALIQALRNEEIAGAGLDVFAEEPLPEESPLWNMPHVIVTPHIGGMSDIYPDQVLPNIKENLSRYLAGERNDLINFVDWSK